MILKIRPPFKRTVSNQSIETFFALLQQYEIEVLVDVRSSPYSKYVPHFNSTALVVAVEQADIKYMFMGQELGGRPDGDEFYDVDGRVFYKRVAESSLFLRGIQRLKEVGRTSRTALMCSEEDPATCHRHILIGHVLTKQGVDLLHIRGDGHLQDEKDLTSREEKPFYAQSLWGEQLSDEEWELIKELSFHDLCHDFAHRAREAGWALEEIAYLLSRTCHNEGYTCNPDDGSVYAG